MTVDWRRLTRDAGLRVEGDRIEVALHDHRSQRLFVDERRSDTMRLWSIVAAPSAIGRLDTPRADAWRRNRLTELVGFTIDPQGRMIGETWVPTAGLGVSEWTYYVQAIARASDRFEYLLTGDDAA